MNQDTRNRLTGWAASVRRSAESLITKDQPAAENLIDQLYGAGEALGLMNEHELAAEVRAQGEAIEQFRRGFSAGRRFIPQAVREQANG